MSDYHYQIGGSLTVHSPTYVERQADRQLYDALISGEFCYVLDSRQMGKSSLLVRTFHRLKNEGYQCSAIDLTRIGSENITPTQWYKGMVAELWRGFNLFGQVNLKTWWRDEEEVSLLSRLSHFIEDVLLVKFPEDKVFIFVDEIDSILGLSFSVDDFFALIRFCYNQRAINPEYKRLTFAIFGVATPSDLIADKNRTPFNIGTAIALNGFTLTEAEPLAKGFAGTVENYQKVLQEILNWTSGQPFLTQKLCDLVVKTAQTAPGHLLKLPPGSEEFWVENLVRSQIIENWESQDEPEHLKTIRDRLLRNEKRASRLLGIYQQILQSDPPQPPPWQGGELESKPPFPMVPGGIPSEPPFLRGAGGIPSDDSREQIELILAGLTIKRNGFLTVKNRIYQEVFNRKWVEKQLGYLRPYSQSFEAWIASDKIDESRLLRGQALKDAQMWAQGKSLSDEDYKYLAASQESDRKEVQIALDASRAREAEARLFGEKKNAKLQRWLLIAVGLGMLISTAMGGGIFIQYRQLLRSERQARISEVKALASSSDGLFASNRRLDALIEAIKAKRRMQRLQQIDSEIEQRVSDVLEQAVYETDEVNRLSGHEAAVMAVAIAPNSELIASASVDKTIKLWRRDGTEIATLRGHQANIRALAFSPDGTTLVSASADRTLKLWNLETLDRDPIPYRTIEGHAAAVWGVAFSPDGEAIASSSIDGNVKLWRTDGTLLKTLQEKGAGVWSITFSPDGDLIASASFDNTVKLWNRDGSAAKTLRGHTALVGGVQFSPDSQTLASAANKTIKLWTREGTEIRSLEGHTAAIYGIAWSPDGQTLASAGIDQIVKLWSIDGSELATLKGHSATIWALAWSPDGSYIASAGAENVVRLWQSQNPFRGILTAEKGGVWGVDISSNSQAIATGSVGGLAKVWNTQGKLLREIPANYRGSASVAFSPDDRFVVAAGSENSVNLWQTDGTLVKRFRGHTALVWTVAFSPQGILIASGGEDQTIKLWRTDGTLINTLTGHDSTVWEVAFSPDGETIASASADGTIKLWALDGTLLRTIEGHEAAVWRVAFSPDGQLLASGSGDNTVKLWTIEGTLLRTLEGHTAAVWGVAFSPDSKIVASGSVDNTVKLWTLEDTPLATLRGHTGAIRQLKYSPDGKFVASGAEDNTLILWNVERVVNLDLLGYGCDRVRDYLRTNQQLSDADRHLCDSQ